MIKNLVSLQYNFTELFSLLTYLSSTKDEIISTLEFPIDNIFVHFERFFNQSSESSWEPNGPLELSIFPFTHMRQSQRYLHNLRLLIWLSDLLMVLGRKKMAGINRLMRCKLSRLDTWISNGNTDINITH
jgi:hypothetical protein